MTEVKRVFRRPTLTSTPTSARGSDFTTRDAFMNSVSAALLANPEGLQKLISEIGYPTVIQNEVIKYSHNAYVQPAQWQPRFKLPSGYSPNEVVLNTLEVAPLKNLTISFNLKKQYSIEAVLPRSYFGIIMQCSQVHNFVFSQESNQNSVFFQELTGLRQSTYVILEETDSASVWELHLKPSKGYYKKLT
jgi:hypothetical protein